MATWLDLLGSHIGAEAYSSYDYILRPTQQERFYLDVAGSILSPSEPGQRVQSPGPEEQSCAKGRSEGDGCGDAAIDGLSLAEEFGQNVTLVVLREVNGEGKAVEVTWWPRTWDKVLIYQWEKAVA